MELEQENLNQELETQIETPAEISAPTLEDLREGKISIRQLSREERGRLSNEARDKLPDDEAKEAWDLGWRSQEFFGGRHHDGSPKEFVDYKEFLKKVNDTAPVKNERIRTLSKEKEEKDKQIAELKDQMKKILEINKMSQERSIASEEDQVKIDLQDAENEGDIQKFKIAQARLNQIQQNKERLKTFEEVKKEEPEVPYIPEDVQLEINDWIARNSWYTSDARITNYCNEQSGILARSRPDLTLSERLELVKQNAKLAFPQINSSAKPTVLSTKTSGFGGTPKVSMTFDQLPEKEKAVGEWALKQGIYKTKADVVKAYLNQNKNK